MNEMRKLMEAIEQINEVSDHDGPALDDLIERFVQTCKLLGINDDPVKKKELTQIMLARAEDLSGLGHENVLGHDHQADFGGWPNKQQ